MRKTIHVSIDERDFSSATQADFPFCFRDGSVFYRGDAARNFLQTIEPPGELQFEFAPNEKEKFITHILPNLPQPDKSRLHSIESSSATSEILSNWQLTYVLQPKVSLMDEAAEFSQLLVDSNDMAKTALEGISEITASDTSGLARTRFSRTHSNRATLREFSKRQASQDISKTADRLSKKVAKVGKVIKVGHHITKAAQRYMQEGSSFGEVLAHGGYDFATDCLQEQLSSIVLSPVTGMAVRKLLLVGGALTGVTVTGGFSVVVVFAASMATDYLFVEYIWNPTIEALRQNYLEAFPHHNSGETTVPGMSDYQSSLIMDLPFSEDLKKDIPDLLISLINHSHKDPLVKTATPFALSQTSSLVPHINTTTLSQGSVNSFPSVLSGSENSGTDLDYAEKMARFQADLKKRFDYSNPVYSNTHVFSKTNLFRSERFSPPPSEPILAHTSFFLDNYGGKLRGEFSVDVFQHPALATFLLGAHLLKSLYHWKKMPETEKHKINIQTSLEHIRRCKEEGWWNWHARDKFLSAHYTREQIIEKHMQELGHELGYLEPSSQDIIYFKKMLRFFIKTGNHDAVLAITGNDSVKMEKYSNLYAGKFYASSKLVLDFLMESNVKQAAQANTNLQEEFSDEPLTHALHAMVLNEKKEFEAGRKSLNIAKEMAMQDLVYAKKEREAAYWKARSTKPFDTSDSDMDIDFYSGDGQRIVSKSEEQCNRINEMAMHFYENAYHHSQGNNKNIYWQEWQKSTRDYAEKRPHLESAQIKLANVYLAEDRIDDAINIYQKIKTPLSLFNLGGLLYKKGDYEKALSTFIDFELTRKGNSGLEEKYLSTGVIAQQIYMDNKNLDGAVQQAKFILSLSTINSDIIAEQAWFLGLNGYPKEGLCHLKPLLNDPDITENPERFSKINHAMGDCYFLLRSPSEALQCYTRALETDANDPYLLTNCARIALNFGNLQQARLLANHIKEIAPNFEQLDSLSSEIQSTYSAYVDSAFWGHLKQCGIQLFDIGVSKFMEQDWGDWTSDVKKVGSLVKVCLAAMPLWESCTKDMEGVLSNEKLKILSNFAQALIKHKIAAIELEGATQRLLGAENGWGYRTLHGFTFLCSATLILDQMQNRSLLSDKQRFCVASVLNIASVVGKIDTVYNAYMGVESLSTIHQIFGATLANQLIYVDAGAFFVARSFDLYEAVAKYYQYEVPERTEYHLAKCTLQGASFGLVVGKLTTLGAAKLGILVIPPEPTTALITGVTALTAVSVGAGIMWGLEHYQNSQLTAIIDNSEIRFKNKDLPGALENINKACEYKPNYPQLELRKCEILSLIAIKKGDVKQAVSVYDEFLSRFPGVIELEENSNINENYKRLKAIHQIEILTEAKDYSSAIQEKEDYIKSYPEEKTNVPHLIALYVQKWDKLLTDKANPIALESRLDSALAECSMLKKQYSKNGMLEEKYERLYLQKLILDKNYELAVPKIQILIEKEPDKEAKKKLIDYKKEVSQAFIAELSARAKEAVDYDKALDACLKHLSDYPTDEFALDRYSALRCVAPLSSHNYEETINACNERLRDFSSDDSDALRYRLRAYIGQNELEKAENDAQHILRLNPKDADALFQKAIICLNTGYLGQALDNVNSATSVLDEKISNTDTEVGQVVACKTLLEGYRGLENMLNERIATIHAQTVSGVLSSAVSSGISYWVQSSVIKRNASVPFLFFTTREKPQWAPKTTSNRNVVPISFTQCLS